MEILELLWLFPFSLFTKFCCFSHREMPFLFNMPWILTVNVSLLICEDLYLYVIYDNMLRGCLFKEYVAMHPMVCIESSRDETHLWKFLPLTSSLCRIPFKAMLCLHEAGTFFIPSWHSGIPHETYGILQREEERDKNFHRSASSWNDSENNYLKSLSCD